MTLPDEMFNSLRSARSFMFDLLDPAIYPKLPKQTRLAASARLKHFPTEYEIDQLENFYNNAHKDKNILLAETNKEIQRIGNEFLLANKRINELTQSIQEFVNK